MSEERGRVLLIDVREPEEHAIGNIGGELIPLAQLWQAVQRLKTIKQPIVLYCRSGDRSLAAARFLQMQGIKDVGYLEGGLLAWKDEVDASLPL